MDGAASPLMPGVHRRQQVDDLRASDLADDDAIGPHAQCLTDKIAQSDLPGALEICGARLQADHMRMSRSQLR